MFKNKKNIILTILFAIFVLSTFSFLNVDLNKKTVYAISDQVQVVDINNSANDGTYDINSAQFRSIIGSVSGNLTVQLLGHCTLTSTLEINAKTNLKTIGRYSIKRSDDFVLIKTNAEVAIGDDSSDIITLDGSNFSETILQNIGQGSKVLTINNLVICGNSGAAPTFVQTKEYGAVYNSGTMIVKNIDISNCFSDYGSAIYNVGTFKLNAGKIHNNTCMFGGTIANFGDFNIGDTYKTLDKTNLSVKIYENLSLGNYAAGILNGELPSQAYMLVYDCEIYDNVIQASEKAVGAGIANYATLQVNYCELKNNKSQCALKNGKAFAVGAGIYNAGENGEFAVCRIYDAVIEDNSCEMFSNASFGDNVKINANTENCKSYAAGVANLGQLTINGGSIKQNNAIDAKDIWLGDENASDQQSNIKINCSTAPVVLGEVYVDLLNYNFQILNVDDYSDLSFGHLFFNENIPANSIVVKLQSCTNSVVKTILQNSNNKIGFDTEGNNVLLKYLITFKTKINGTAKFAERLTAEIIEFKVNGEVAAMNEIVDASDVITYKWYYYSTTTLRDETLSINADYVIGSGLIGKKINLSAEIQKSGYVSSCLQNAQTAPVEKQQLDAVWGSTATNWNSEKNSFEYNGENQYPIVINFPTEFSDKISYSFKKANNDAVENTKTAGEYKVSASANSEDITLQNSTFQFKITKKMVKMPKIINTRFQFNYKMQTLEYDELDPIVDVSGEKATSAGSYTAVFSLRDKTNYVWENGSSYDLQIGWMILYPVSPLVFVFIIIGILVIVGIVILLRYKRKRRMRRIRDGINTKAINDFNKK